MLHQRLTVVALLAVAACSDDATAPSTTLRMSYARTGSVFDAPWPDDNLLRDGKVVFAFPNPANRLIVRDAIDLINESAHGFSLAGGIFFRSEGPLDAARFPTLADSTAATSPVQLIDLESKTRHPVEVSITAEETLYSPANVLTLLPLAGLPLKPKAHYTAIVLRDLHDAAAKRLGQSAAMAALAAGQRPSGLTDEGWRTYQMALAALGEMKIDLDDVAAMTAFTTDDPTAGFMKFRDHVLAQPVPRPKAAFVAHEVFDDFCVYQSTIDMPSYQQGEAPYMATGGGWPLEPAIDHFDEAKLIVTIPRRPASGPLPTVVMVRTGAGGDRAIVERGTWNAMRGPIEPGEGPGRYFARAGFAGITVDGPLGGLRDRGGEEQLIIFNPFNGRALRDNIRESALELVLMASIVDGLPIDASSCPGGPGKTTLSSSKLVIFGHSTGAWITQLVLAGERRYQAAILSGAGAGFIGNVLYKEEPVAVAPVVEGLLGTGALAPGDPVLSLIQWAAEPADPQVYAGLVAPRHILMEQGIVDHYILPRLANATSLPLGLDLAGQPLDATAGLPAVQLPLEGLLGYTGRGQIPLPASGNRDGMTAIVVQHPADGVLDGHEVIFQLDEPKREYRCFLESFVAGGAPRVPAPGVGPCE